MSELKCFGCGEKGKYYPYVPSKIYCFSCYDKIVKERDALRAENEIYNIAISEIYAATFIEGDADWKQIIQDITGEALEVTK